MIILKSILVYRTPSSSGGTSIQFQEEGVNLGNNQADTVNFTGDGVTASRVGNTVTVDIDASIGDFWKNSGTTATSGDVVVNTDTGPASISIQNSTDQSGITIIEDAAGESAVGLFGGSTGGSAGEIAIQLDVTNILGAGTGLRVVDQRGTPRGLQTAASGYVTDDRSYADKEYVDNVAGSVFVYPESYGAVGDGSTNDATAIQDCITDADTNDKIVYFSAGKNYRVNSEIDLPTNIQVKGGGYGSIISTTSNINIFNITGTNVSIENLSFLGNSAGAAQVGIRQAGVLFTTLLYGLSVRNCNFVNLNFAGIYSTNTPGTNTSHEGGIKGDNLYFQNCGTGLYVGDRTEYCVFNEIKAVACGIGIYNIGGNNQYNTGTLTTCTAHGFRADTGANDGKFTVSNFSINHNAVGILCFGLLNGGIFQGCSVLASTSNPINIATSTGVFFNNCDISGAGNITLTGNSGRYGFKNCRWVQTPAFNLVSGVAAVLEHCTPGLLIPAALSANTNNYAPVGIDSATTIRITATTPIDFTGMNLGGTMSDERELTMIILAGSSTITFKTDVTSTANFRLLMPADFPVGANSVLKWVYDITSTKWRLASYYSTTGGSASWGGITGTLSDQTDLQNELDGKQPLDSNLTTIAGLTATTNNFMVAFGGDWASRTPAQARQVIMNPAYYTNNSLGASTVTGTTETLVDSVLIPANTLAAGDILYLWVFTTKTGTNGAQLVRVKTNTSASLVGATLIALNIAGTTSVVVPIERHIHVVSTTSQIVIATGSSSSTDDANVTNAHTALAVDFTVDQHVIVSLQGAGAGTDVLSLRGWYLQIIRA